MNISAKPKRLHQIEKLVQRLWVTVSCFSIISFLCAYLLIVLGFLGGGAPVTLAEVVIFFLVLITGCPFLIIYLLLHIGAFKYPGKLLSSIALLSKMLSVGTALFYVFAPSNSFSYQNVHVFFLCIVLIVTMLSMTALEFAFYHFRTANKLKQFNI